MSASLRLPLTHHALDQTVLPLGIIQALGAVTATATTAAAVVVTRDHTTPGEAIPAADIAGVTPEGGPLPMTHHDPGPPSITAISHGPTEGVNPVIEVGLNHQGGTPVINPILQIASAPDVLRSLLTGNDVEHRV